MDSGNALIRIPLFGYPQKGRLNLHFSVVGNATYWVPEHYCYNDGNSCDNYYLAAVPSYPDFGYYNPRPYLVGGAGRLYLGPAIVPDTSNDVTVEPEQSQVCDTSSCLNLYSERYAVVDSTGASHPLYYDASDPSKARTTDGTGFLVHFSNAQPYYTTYDPSLTLYDASGIRSTSGITSDLDGNSIVSPGFPDSAITDSVNRIIPTPSSNVDTSTSGCPDLGDPYQPAVGSTQWNVRGPNGQISSYLICYAKIRVHSNFWGQNGQNYGYNSGNSEPGYTSFAEVDQFTAVIQSVVLPNGLFWGFLYDAADPNNDTYFALGTLNKIIYPTGGSISYAYAETQLCDNSTGFAVGTRTVDDGRGHSYLWTYNYGLSSSPLIHTVTDPNQNDTAYEFVDQTSFCGARVESERRYYKGTGGTRSLVKKVVTSGYQYVAGPTELLSTTFNGAANDFPTVQTTYLDGQLVSTENTTYTPNTFIANAPSCELTNHGCQVAVGLNQTLSLGFTRRATVAGSDGSVLHDVGTAYAWEDSAHYPGYLDANLINTPSTITEYDASGTTALAKTTYGYDDSNHLDCAGTKGHPTSETRWNNLGPDITTTTDWTCWGFVKKKTDGRLNATQYTPDSSGIFAASIDYPPTNGVSHTDHFTWDLNSGNKLSHIDWNNVSSSYEYADPLGRMTKSRSAIGTPEESTTVFTYPSATETDVAADFHVKDDGALLTKTFFDGIGRPTRRTAPSGDSIDVQYDGLDHVLAQSNPYPSSGSASVFTRYTYDELGRKLLQCQQDNGTGAVCQAGSSYREWVYTGNAVDAYDEARNHSEQVMDALGRVTKVLEPDTSNNPSLETDYTYDALANLTAVIQHGTAEETARSRSFTYDSLSRLVCSANPETNTPTGGPTVTCPSVVASTYPAGTATYNYDANGNLNHKTDANGITTDYLNDALNRVYNETAADGSLNSTYSYDVAPPLWGGTPYTCTYGNGRLCQVDHPGFSGTAFNYGPMGRVASSLYASITSGPPYKLGMSATYDLAGNALVLTYADQRQIKQIWDAGGRLASISDITPGGTSTSYIAGVEYWSSGTMKQAVYGNGVSQSWMINSRLQPCRSTAVGSYNGTAITLFDHSTFHSFPAVTNCTTDEPGNNGNVYSIVDNVTSLSQSFSYDKLNRVTQGFRSDGTYNQSYNYDSFGNLKVIDTLAPNSAVKYKIDDATNRMLRSHDGGTTWGDYVYDSTGVMIQSGDGISAPHTYQHNTLGQITSLDSGSTATYAYNGLGERAYKITPSGWTNYIYFNGQPMSEQKADGTWTDYVYANGQRIAKAGTTHSAYVLKGIRRASDSACDVNARVMNWSLMVGAVGTIQPGDILSLDQRTISSDATSAYVVGGVIQFTTAGNGAVNLYDQNGDNEAWGKNDGQWHHRAFDVGQAIPGQVLDAFLLFSAAVMPVGPWEQDYANITYTRANGTVLTFPVEQIQASDNGTVALSGNPVDTCGSSNMTGSVAVISDSTYYLADSLGTVQMELDGNGGIRWQGQFTPFGQEIVGGQVMPNGVFGPYTSASTTHYKFTGKERDAESGLDYFGARYYASSMGRWMSPDWAANPEAVPYSKLDNPQSLNLYQYVLNNPLSQKDDDGHEIKYADGLKNSQLVQDSVTAILANPNTSSYLSGYVGPNAPTLTIQSGDLGPPTVTTLPNGQVVTTTVQGNTAPAIQSGEEVHDGVASNVTKLMEATITVDNNTSKGDTPGVMIHESVHAGEALANPAKFAADAKAERGQPHDSRPQEQRANGVRAANEKQIKQQIKQIEKARQKEPQ
jgi:RHS repeat-associated protein